MNLFIVLFVFIQAVIADIYSQLQFIEIVSPTGGQRFQAGETLNIVYIVQPLILNRTSKGYAKSLEIYMYDNNEEMFTISSDCSVEASRNDYMTHEIEWYIPDSIKTGFYTLEFTEKVQLRHHRITSIETVKINID